MLLDPSLVFWAKAHDTDDGKRVWHSLIDHCADVAACMEALLERPVVAQRLAAAGGVALTPVQRARLCVLSALHDAGKANLGFQRRIRGEGMGVGHVGPLLALLYDTRAEARSPRRRMTQALRLREMAAWFGTPEDMDLYLRAILAHHGAPAEGTTASVQVWSAARGLDPVRGVADLADAAGVWFPEAATPGEPLPAAAPFIHAFTGLLMLADWLGSDERFFPYAGPPYTGPGDGDRMTFARDRARRALETVGLAPDAARRRLGVALPSFKHLFDLEPRPAQEAIVALDHIDDGGLTILESETGSGKTEAALRRFLELFRAGTVDGLYFALPTRTAAVQIHERIRAVAARVFGDDAPPVVLAVPGYLRVDDAEGERPLPGFEVLWPDGGAGSEGRGWAAEHPKRYCAAAIAVGTIDQALMAALQIRHAHLRGAALLRQLVVVDEVHASDPYMATLLGVLLDLLRTAGGRALLLSATLGAAARTRLLGRPVAEMPDMAEAMAAPYPLLITRSGHRESPAVLDGGRTVATTLAQEADAPESVAARALAAARMGARVLVIRNTVRDALATQAAVEAAAAEAGAASVLFSCEGRPAPHHSRFAREDRKRLDAALEARFGKDAPATAAVAVTTQTAEQSLDIDADLLITDLCPADVLLQRLGRLHRHQRSRPDACSTPSVIVLVPEPGALGALIAADGSVRRSVNGLGSVYPNLLAVEATRRALATHPELRLPAMNRALVEGATHPQALGALAAELGGGWPAHHGTLFGREAAERSVARLNALDWAKPIPAAFPGPEVDIATRLGLDDRQVLFPPGTPGPFGADIRTLTIPGWQCRGLDAATSEPADLAVTSGGLRFRLGDRSFDYDRLGLRPVDPAP